MRGFTPRVMIALCAIAISGTGCIGLYADLVVARPLDTSYQPDTHKAGGPQPVTPTATGGMMLGLAVGTEFDMSRSARLGFEYGHSNLTLPEGSTAKADNIGAELDFNVYSVSDQLKVRLGGGASGGTGENSMPALAGGAPVAGGGRSLSLFGGVGAEYYFVGHLALRGMVGGGWATQPAGAGDLGGPLAFARLGVSLLAESVADTRASVEAEKFRKLTFAAEAADTELSAIRAAYDAGHPFPPDEIVARLQRACTAGVRLACGAHGVDTILQRGDRSELEALARGMFRKGALIFDGVGHLTSALMQCSYGSWRGCQAAKATFHTFYPWLLPHGPSLAALFPSSTQPDFPVAMLDAIKPGRGWSCFSYTQVFERTKALESKGGLLVEGEEIGNTAISDHWCARTKEECESIAAAAPATKDFKRTGSCTPFHGLLDFYRQDSPSSPSGLMRGFQDPSNCRTALKFAGPNTTGCVTVGDVTSPGL